MRTSPSRVIPFLVVLAALLLAAPAWAQGKPAKKKTGVVLYRDMVAAKWDTVKCVKNAIKLNPLLFFRGEIPLLYERALSHRLSVELGVGFTWRNYLNLSVGNNDADDYGAGTNIIAKPTYHLGVRWYHTDDIEPQGWYTQLGFAHIEYIKDIKVKNPDGSFSTEKNRDERIYNDIRLLSGYQLLSASSNWLFDVYGGVALRNRSLQIVSESLDLVTDQWTYTVEEKNDIVPAFFLGVKVGLGF